MLFPSKVVIWLLSPSAIPDALELDASGREMKELVGKWVSW